MFGKNCLRKSNFCSIEQWGILPHQGAEHSPPSIVIPSVPLPTLSSRAQSRDLLIRATPLMYCPFLSAQKKRTKRKHHPPKALPQGRDATAPSRRSFIKVCSDHQRSGILSATTRGWSPYWGLAPNKQLWRIRSVSGGQRLESHTKTFMERVFPRNKLSLPYKGRFRGWCFF